MKKREGNVTKQNKEIDPHFINIVKQYYKKNPNPRSLKCLRSIANTITPKDVESLCSEALPLLPWGKRRARDIRASLLFPLQADGRRDKAVNPKANLLSASPFPSSIHPSSFLHIGIAHGASALLLSCLLCSCVCLFWLFLELALNTQHWEEQICAMLPMPLKLMVVLLHWMEYGGISSLFPQSSTNWASMQHRNSSWAPGLIWKLFNQNDMLPAYGSSSKRMFLCSGWIYNREKLHGEKQFFIKQLHHITGCHLVWFSVVHLLIFEEEWCVGQVFLQ